ncbi:MAG: hypothetical protein NWF07_03320 [Candidatus Bathyarchaeota archaeon]|nr:hypothetical protein [Candidatus Bathyarchaeota archaeon]
MADIRKRYRYGIVLLVLIVVWHVPTVVSWMVIQSGDVSGVDVVFLFGVKGNGIDPVNRLDTRVDVFRKDMVADPPIELVLVLSDEDKAMILERMGEIGFHWYPVFYTPWGSDVYVDPATAYQLTLYWNGVPVKMVRMDTDLYGDDLKTSNLRSLYGLIMRIIYESEVYKNSPEPTAAYG